MPSVPSEKDNRHIEASTEVNDVEILASQDGYLGQMSCRYLLRYGERCFVVATVRLVEDPHGIESTWWADVDEVAIGKRPSHDRPLIQAELSAESQQKVLGGAMELIRRMGRLAA